MPGPVNPELARVAAIYDEIAPTWDQRQGVVERMMMGRRMRVALANQLRGDVLEVGTGTGPTLKSLADNLKITSFVGVDLSTGMLDVAREHAGKLQFPVVLRHMDAGRLDFPNSMFDTVTTSLTLCTVPDPELTLREMARVCKPEGRIVLLEHVRARNPILLGMQKALSPLQVRMLGCHLDRPTDRLIRSLGFRVEHESTRFVGVFRLIVAQPPSAASQE